MFFFRRHLDYWRGGWCIKKIHSGLQKDNRGYLFPHTVELLPSPLPLSRRVSPS